MPVITLSRQFGAGGAPIGRTLAGRFGVPSWIARSPRPASARASRSLMPEGYVTERVSRFRGLDQRPEACRRAPETPLTRHR
jgi:hypothetical protein